MKSKETFIPRLVVIEGNDKGKVIPLKDGTLVIGRSKGDILIHDPRISRSHVALHFDERKGTLTFTDLKSLNGVVHNGAAVETGEINDGDKLQLGNTTFDCQIAREGAEATINATHPAKALKAKEAALERAEKKKREKEKPKEEELELVPLLDGKEELLVKDTTKENSDSTRISVIRTKLSEMPRRTKTIAMASIVAILAILVLNKTPKVGDLASEITAARSLASQGKYQEAVSKAEAISKLFSETSETFMLLGDLYAQQGKNEQALTSYRKAHDLPPAQPLVHLRLIRIFLRAGLSKEAEGELKHVDEIIRKEGAPSKDVFLETAEIFLEFKELKQPPEKLFILAKALQNAVAPGEKIGYKLEAQSYLLQNRNAEAIDTLTAVLKMDPKDEWAYENLAFSKLTLSDVTGAFSVVENWLKVYPDSTKALLVMSYLKFNDEKFTDAEPLVRKVIDLLAGAPTEPHYAESLHLLGQIYVRTNRPGEGTGFLKQSCDLGFTQSCTAMNDTSAKRNAPASTGATTEVPQPTEEATGTAPEASAPQIATPPSQIPGKKPGE